MSSKRVLILECIPKKDGKDEGRVLSEFLRMTESDCYVDCHLTNKADLMRILSGGKILPETVLVHLSGHGDFEKRTFNLARGSMSIEDFPDSCFKDKIVTFSACSLGRKDFVVPFMERTQARVVVAPMNEVQFIDAALFFVLFYYLVLDGEMRETTAFDKAVNSLPSRTKGGFKFWS